MGRLSEMLLLGSVLILSVAAKKLTVTNKLSEINLGPEVFGQARRTRAVAVPAADFNPSQPGLHALSGSIQEVSQFCFTIFQHVLAENSQQREIEVPVQLVNKQWLSLYSVNAHPPGMYCCSGEVPAAKLLARPTCWQTAAKVQVGQLEAEKRKEVADMAAKLGDTFSADTVLIELDNEINAASLFQIQHLTQDQSKQYVLAGTLGALASQIPQHVLIAACSPKNDNVCSFMQPLSTDDVQASFLEVGSRQLEENGRSNLERAMASELVRRANLYTKPHSPTRAIFMTFPDDQKISNTFQDLQKISNSLSSEGSEAAVSNWCFTLPFATPKTDATAHETTLHPTTVLMLDQHHAALDLYTISSDMLAGDYCCNGTAPATGARIHDLTDPFCWPTAYLLPKSHVNTFQNAPEVALLDFGSYKTTVYASVEKRGNNYIDAVNQIVNHIQADPSTLFLIENEEVFQTVHGVLEGLTGRPHTWNTGARGTWRYIGEGRGTGSGSAGAGKLQGCARHATCATRGRRAPPRRP